MKIFNHHPRITGVQAIASLFLVCLLSLNIQGCKSENQTSPIPESVAPAKGEIGLAMQNVGELLAQSFSDAASKKVMLSKNREEALKKSFAETVQRIKGNDYCENVKAKTSPHDLLPSWSIKSESASSYFDRSVRKANETSRARIATSSQTFKDYLDAIQGTVGQAGSPILAATTSEISGQTVTEQVSQKLNNFDRSVRNDIRLSAIEKDALLATTSLTRTTVGPAADLVKGSFDVSNPNGRVAFWRFFRAVVNIVLTIVVVVAVLLVVAALVVYALPAAFTVLGLALTDQLVGQAILFGGVGSVFFNAVQGDYLCFLPDDGLNC